MAGDGARRVLGRIKALVKALIQKMNIVSISIPYIHVGSWRHDNDYRTRQVVSDKWWLADFTYMTHCHRSTNLHGISTLLHTVFTFSWSFQPSTQGMTEFFMFSTGYCCDGIYKTLMMIIMMIISMMMMTNMIQSLHIDRVFNPLQRRDGVFHILNRILLWRRIQHSAHDQLRLSRILNSIHHNLNNHVRE